MDVLAAARAAIDLAHDADPQRVDGVAVERRYADAVEAWVRKLVPSPSVELQLAARAQHLERWAIPRADFPMDRPGYHQWRRAVQARQGERARALLRSAGCGEPTCARVEQLVAKAAPKADADAQALEDAACLVFLERELAAFAAQHADYAADKFIDILRKTWAKMSPAAHRHALALELDPSLAALVRTAVGC